MKTLSITLTTLIFLAVSTQVSAANDPAPFKVNVSAKLALTNWRGDNNNIGEKDFEAKANQLVLGIGFQKGRLYGGLSLQGGDFKFDDPAPERVTETTSIPSKDVTLKHGETDLIVGYYFWSQVSLFADIKSVKSTWQDQEYSMEYTGLGIGVSGFHPLSPQLTLYGSYGVVPFRRIEAKGNDIGDGVGGALDLGLSFKAAEQVSLNVGLKSQTQKLEFDNGDEQTHHRGGLYFGIQYRF